MRQRVILILTGIVIIFVFQFCSEDKEEKESNIHYSPGTDKISGLVSDFELGVKFQPPKDWAKRAAEISSKVETRGVYGGYLGQFTYEPSYVFFDDSTLSVLAMGRISPPDSLKGNDNVLNLYAQAISSKKDNDQKYDVEQFSKDSIRFTIFTIKRANIISRRLIFLNKFNDIIQFEYTVRSNELQPEDEKIKQSIGSIRLL